MSQSLHQQYVSRQDRRNVHVAHIPAPVTQSLGDIIHTSPDGQKFIAQMQENKANIARRIRTLKELVHYTFVEYAQQNQRRVRFDVYTASKDRIRELGINGGEEYDTVYNSVLFARTSFESFCAAIDLLLPQEEHDCAAYESSDGLARHQ